MTSTLDTPSDADADASSWSLGIDELRSVDLFVLVVVAAHLLLPSEPFAFPAVSRTITLLALAPLGVVHLVRLGRRGDRPALAMLAFLLSASISGMFAAVPLRSFRGDVAGWMSVLVYVAAAGWWALGRRLDDPARRVLPWVLLAVLSVNAVLGFAQIALDIRSGPLATVGGRAQGFLDNPVFYGTLWSGACAWLLMSAATRHVGWTLAVAAAAFATGISGSRAAAGAVVLAGLAVIALARSRWAAVNLGAAMAGLASASFVAQWFTASGTLDRVVANSGSNFRLEMWRAGMRSVMNRPVFGHGFEHFSTAVDGELPLEFLRANQFDDLTNPTRVPHNFVVLLLVSVGIVGTLLFLAWLVLALRGSIDVPLMVAAAAILANWSLQPASHHSLPIAMLLVGAAVRAGPSGGEPPDELPDDAGEPGRLGTAGAVIAGLLIAAFVGAGSYRIGAADGPDGIANAAAVFPGDALVARTVSLEYEAAAVRGDVGLDLAVTEAIRWAEREVEVAPAAHTYARIARLNLAVGRFDAAEAAIERALALQRWNPNALEMRVALATELGDAELLEAATDDACAVGLPICSPEASSGG